MHWKASDFTLTTGYLYEIRYVKSKPSSWPLAIIAEGAMVLGRRTPRRALVHFNKGNNLSKEDLIQLEGKIADITGGGNYQVKLDNGIVVLARLSGKMKKFKIKVLVGDRVTVGVSPYDPSHGLITHRQRV